MAQTGSRWSTLFATHTLGRAGSPTAAITTVGNCQADSANKAARLAFRHQLATDLYWRRQLATASVADCRLLRNTECLDGESNLNWVRRSQEQAFGVRQAGTCPQKRRVMGGVVDGGRFGLLVRSRRHGWWRAPARSGLVTRCRFRSASIPKARVVYPAAANYSRACCRDCYPRCRGLAT